MSKRFPITLEEKYEALSNQCVPIKDLIPSKVNGYCTSSMACDPSEVLYFAEMYIKELQEELINKNN